VHGAEALPDGAHHALIVAAMTSFYLSAPATAAPGARPAAQRVLETMGGLRDANDGGAPGAACRQPTARRPAEARHSSAYLRLKYWTFPLSTASAGANMAKRETGSMRKPRTARQIRIPLSSRQ